MRNKKKRKIRILRRDWRRRKSSWRKDAEEKEMRGR